MGITLYNRQRKIRLDLPRLQRLAEAALAQCPGLGEVEVTFVSDAAIARVHREFMNVSGATDVITFDHGEIVISPETVRENAAHYGRPPEEELLRCIVHGFLHLSGYRDDTPADFATMHEVQEQTVRRVAGI